MKKLLKNGSGLLAGFAITLVTIIALFLFFWLGPTVKKTVERIGPQALGTEVTVGNIRIDPLRGTIHIQNLYIGNPEGFTNPSAIELKSCKVVIDLQSLRTDTIVIKEIRIENPEFTYERKLQTDNFKELQKNVEAYTAKNAGGETQGEKEKGADGASSETAAKKVIIERLIVIDGKVNAKISALPTAPIPLPGIEKTDIGKDDGGASWGEAGKEVLSVIYGSILEAVTNIGGMTGDVIKSAGNSVTDAGSSFLERIGQLFKKKEDQ